MQTLDQIAKDFNVDLGSLQSLLSYLQSNIEKSPGLKEILVSGDSDSISSMIKSGVEAWHKSSEEFLTNLAFSQEQKFVDMRSEMCNTVYDTIKEQQNV